MLVKDLLLNEGSVEATVESFTFGGREKRRRFVWVNSVQEPLFFKCLIIVFLLVVNMFVSAFNTGVVSHVRKHNGQWLHEE